MFGLARRPPPPLPPGNMRLSTAARSDLLAHLALALEMQLNSLNDMEPVQLGITDESFEAIPTVNFVSACPDYDTLALLPVEELKRLADAHDLLERVYEYGGDEHESMLELLCPPCDEASATSAVGTPRASAISQSSQCAICQCDFAPGEELKVLPCSGHHAFHTACIQTWLNKQSSCPLCRNECGERRPPPPAADDPLRDAAPLGTLLAMLSQHTMIAQVPSRAASPTLGTWLIVALPPTLGTWLIVALPPTLGTCPTIALLTDPVCVRPFVRSSCPAQTRLSS